MAFSYFIFLISALYISHMDAANISVTIQLEYTAIPAREAPSPIHVSVAEDSTILEAMMVATTQDSQYNFGGTYYGGSLGWLIQKYDNVDNDLDTNLCWYLYVQLPGGNPIKQDYGVSIVTVSVDGTVVIFRYELDELYCKVFCAENEKNSDDRVKSEL